MKKYPGITENWYIQIAEENREQVKEWWEYITGRSDFSFTIGFYYGIHDGEFISEGANSVRKWYKVDNTAFLKNIFENGKPKILGYKFKEDKKRYAKAAATICGILEFRIAEIIPFHYSVCYKLKEAGVLDVWFDPVYEEKSFLIHVGSSQTPVKITKEGFEAEGIIYSFEEVSNLYTRISHLNGLTGRCDGKSKVIKVEVEKVKIGCPEFTMQEISAALETYKREFKQ